MKDRETKDLFELVVVVAIFMFGVVIGIEMIGGLVGLLVTGLVFAGIIMFSWFEYKIERKDERTKQRVKKMADAVSRAYSVRLVHDELNHPSSLVVKGDHDRMIAIVRYIEATDEEKLILEETLQTMWVDRR